MSIAEETIEAIRARADIAAVVSQYVTLKRRGRNLVGLCPFHTEKTPSFSVFPERQSWHCFGCGEGGNVFTFLMRIDHLTFPEAVERLGQQVGIPVERSRENAARRSLRQQILEANQAAAEFFARQLEKAPAAQEVLRRRGLSAESVTALGIGYAPPGWEMLLTALGRSVPREVLAQAGLVREREGGGYYDYFRDRLIFPIRDVEGRVLGFGGRALGDVQPKYLNSPETPVFDKSRTLYGLDRARRAIADTGMAIVVEGYMDAAMAQQEGVLNVVATLGTALGATHLEVLRRYAPRVVLAYDGDAAGAAAAERSLPIFESVDMEGHILILPPGQDPDEFIREQGVDAFRQATESALPLVEFQLRRLTERGDQTTPEGRAALIRAVAPVLAAIRHHPKREEYVRRLAEEWSLGQPFVMQHVADALWREVRHGPAYSGSAARLAVGPSRSAAPQAPAGRDQPALPPRIALAEQYVLQGLLSGATTSDQVFDVLTPEDFQVPAHRALARILWLMDDDGDDPLDAIRRSGGEDSGVLEGLASHLLAEQEKLPVTTKMVTDSVWAIKETKLRARINELQLRLAELQSEPGEERTRVEKELQELEKELKDRKAG